MEIQRKKPRTDPFGYAALMAKDEEKSADSLVEYFIIKREWGRAIGILNQNRQSRLIEKLPLFMQFGSTQLPDSAKDLYVRDIVKVTKYCRLFSRDMNLREFESPVSDLASWLKQEDFILPSCIATEFEKTKNGAFQHLGEVAMVTKGQVITDRHKGTARWTAKIVSSGFTEEVQAANFQISGFEHTGFQSKPEEGDFIAVNYAEVHADTPIYGKSMIMPMFYATATGVEKAEKARSQLMFIEKLSRETMAIISRNKGKGCSDHTATSYNAEAEIIRQMKTASAAGERAKTSAIMALSKLQGDITRMEPDHIYMFEANDPRKLDEQHYQAMARDFQPFTEAKLKYLKEGKWIDMFEVNILEFHCIDGKPSRLKLRRKIRRYASDPGELVREVENLADSLEASLKPSTSKEGDESKDKPLSEEKIKTLQRRKDKFDEPDADDTAYFNFKRYPRRGIRLEVDETQTGLEDRIRLLATMPIIPLKDERLLQPREEVLSTLAALRCIQEDELNMPTKLSETARFQIPQMDFEMAPVADWRNPEEEPTSRNLTEDEKIENLKRANFIQGYRQVYNPAAVAPVLKELKDNDQLNEEQKLAIAAMVHKLHPAMFLRAPAGTGKTTVISEIVARMCKYRPQVYNLCVTNNNRAVEKIVQDVANSMQALGVLNGNDPQILWIQSVVTLVEDALNPREECDHLAPFGVLQHAIRFVRKHEDGVIPENQRLSTAKLKKFRAFINDRLAYPGCYTVEDDIVEELLRRSDHIKVIIGTIGKIMQLSKTLQIPDVMFVDEAGQARMIDVELLAIHSNITQLMVTGDELQLAPWIHMDWLHVDRTFRYQLHSVAEFFLAFLPNKCMDLVKTYRFHPAMVPYLTTLYDGRLVNGADPASRMAVENRKIPTATTRVPITLVHSSSLSQDSQGKSLCNPGQEATALAIVRLLRKLHPEASIAVVCYYMGSAMNLDEQCRAAELNRPGMGPLVVHTGHAYIGNESDYEILVTTRTTQAKSFKTDFVHESKLTTVTLTRPKEGLWVIGDMDYLGQVTDQGSPTHRQWTKLATFIRMLTIDSPPLDDAKYCNLIAKIAGDALLPENVQRANNILGDDEGHIRSLVADCRMAMELGWNMGQFTRNN